nr:hypothetical protein [Tanacetum cinerariifolium]
SEGEKTDESDNDDDDQEEAEKVNDDDDKDKEDESFDLIPRTPKESEDDGNGEEYQGLRISEEERMQEEEEADKIYRD